MYMLLKKLPRFGQCIANISGVKGASVALQSRMLCHLLLLGLWLGTVVGEDSLQAVDDAELAKLAQEEKFVVALLCTEENSERCFS